MDYLYLIFFGLIVFFSLLSGLTKGYERSVTRLVCTVVSAALAFFLAKPLAGVLLKKLALNLSVKPDDIVSELMLSSKTLSGFIDSLPRLIAAPLVYVALFIVLDLLSLIISGIINSRKQRSKRGMGMLIGILTGIFSFTVILSPFAAAINMGLDCLAEIPQEYIDKVDMPEYEINGITVSMDMLKEKNTFGECLDAPGNFALSYLTSYKGIKLNKEIKNAMRIIPAAISIADAPGFDPQALSAHIPTILDVAEKSELILPTLKEVLSAASQKWGSGEPFLGIDPAEANAQMKMIISFVCKNEGNITVDGIKGLLKALTEISESMPEEIKDIQSMDIEVLLKSDVLGVLGKSAKENKEVQAVVDSVINEIISESIDDRMLNNSAVMSVVAEAVNSIASSDAAEVEEIASSFGLEVSEGTCEFITDYVNRNFGGSDWDAAKLSEAIKALR